MSNQLHNQSVEDCNATNNYFCDGVTSEVRAGEGISGSTRMKNRYVETGSSLARDCFIL